MVISSRVSDILCIPKTRGVAAFPYMGRPRPCSIWGHVSTPELTSQKKSIFGHDDALVAV